MLSDQRLAPHVDSSTALFGESGELVLISIRVDPRHLEDLLDCLAGLDFPVNPELYHRIGFVLVEFPAYGGALRQVRQAVETSGLDSCDIQVHAMLEACAAAG